MSSASENSIELHVSGTVPALDADANQATKAPQTSSNKRKKKSFKAANSDINHLKSPMADILANTSSIKISSASKSASSNTRDRLRAQVENYVYFEQIGGLRQQIQTLRDLIIRPIEPDARFARFECVGGYPYSGILLYGLPGTGKSMVISAFATVYAKLTNFFFIDCSSCVSKNTNETEAKLNELLEQARQAAPRSVLVIDNIDKMFASKKNPNEQDIRLVSTLCNFLDRTDSLLNDQARVVVIGIARRPDQVDSDLRRSGRLDFEIEFNAPLQPERLEILKILLKNLNHDLNELQIEELASRTIAYTGADIRSLIKGAIMHFNKQDRKKMTYQDFQYGLAHTKPTAMRNIILEVPRVYWRDIGGMQDVKDKMKKSLVWPIKYAHFFKKYGKKQPKGVLLYGPPGCSKTMIGKALATECDHRFIAVKGPEIFNKYVGESERTVREIFEKARQVAPSIIFFDEIDAIAMNRGSETGSNSAVNDKVVATLLNEMDGIENLTDVFIVATTNRPEVLDRGLLRNGRLDSILYVSLPDFQTRKEIFRLEISNATHEFSTPISQCITEIIEILTPVYNFKDNLDKYEFTQHAYDSDKTDETDSEHLDNIEHAESIEEEGGSKPNAIEIAMKEDHYSKVKLPQCPAKMLNLENDFERISISSKKVNRHLIRSQRKEKRIEFVISTLAELTEGYSGAEIINICYEAFISALSEYDHSGKEPNCIEFKHYLYAIKQVKPQTTPEMITVYENFAKKFAQNF